MLQGFLPVTTFGGTYPLDNLIRPFLPRFASAIMVSYHYARQAATPLPLPAFVDSGGFAALLPGARVNARDDGTGQITIPTEDGEEIVSPQDVLALQRRFAKYACPLDFPLPAHLGADERDRRVRLTLANARWLLEQDTGELVLFGVVQGWDQTSYIDCAAELLGMGYTHLAIGGMVPRLADGDFAEPVVSGVRALQAPDSMLHVFGIGKPDRIRSMLQAGATSTDSSSYVKAAADGVRWDGEATNDDPSPLERAHLALANLRYLNQEIGKTAASAGV